MLAHGDSVGVFQMEGAGMRDLLRKMKPDHINDLVALVALYRPGPMDSIPTYIARKNGKEAVEYLHPLLEPILNETYGVMTYQDDVMRIARELAGYTMGEADILRRAMGKKIPAEMIPQREKFMKGAAERGLKRDVAETIFEQAEKFAGYGFNKGHAAAYAQVAYQTALSEGELSGRIHRRLDDAGYRQHRPAEHLPPGSAAAGREDRAARHQSSAKACSAVDAAANTVFYALAAVKGVGKQAMDHVVEVRERGRQVQVAVRFRAPGRSQAGQQAGV